MTRSSFAAILAFVWIAPPVWKAQQDPPAASRASKDAAVASAFALQEAIERVAARAAEFVVTVTAYERSHDVSATAPTSRPSGSWQRAPSNDVDAMPGFRPIRSCSGTVLSASGEILTCRSLLLKSDGALADAVVAETKDGRNTICALVAAEPTLDLALLRLEVFPKGSPPDFGVGELATASPRAGQFAFAVGDPLGPERFFALGLISSLPSRGCYQDQLTATYLQTTMVLHPEAYGGPLVDLDGKILGIMVPRRRTAADVAASRPMGIEFALPSAIVDAIFHALATKQSVRSPWIGIAIMSRAELRAKIGGEAFDALAKPAYGVWIESVFDPSPAHDAGIRPDDVLVTLDGHAIVDPYVFQRLIYLAGIGAEVKLELFRAGEEVDRTLKVTERPKEAVTR